MNQGKQEMARVNINILGISKLKWTGIGEFILKEISPEYSLVGLMLKLKLQYFGHLMQRADSLERP